MKKSVLLLAIGLLLTTGVFAQNKFRFGLSIAPQLCWTKPADNSAVKGKMGTGFCYGLLLDYNAGNNFTIGSGILVSQCKFSYTYATPATFHSNDTLMNYYFVPGSSVMLRMQYIDIPVTIKLKTNALMKDKMVIFGQFGGNIGVKIASKADINGTLMRMNSISTTPYSISLTKEKFTTEAIPLNLGMLVGAGVEYKLAESTSVIAGVFFNNGFVDLTNDKKVNVTNGLGTPGDRAKIAGNTLSLRIGVMF